MRRRTLELLNDFRPEHLSKRKVLIYYLKTLLDLSEMRLLSPDISLKFGGKNYLINCHHDVLPSYVSEALISDLKKETEPSEIIEDFTLKPANRYLITLREPGKESSNAHLTFIENIFSNFAKKNHLVISEFSITHPKIEKITDKEIYSKETANILANLLYSSFAMDLLGFFDDVKERKLSDEERQKINELLFSKKPNEISFSNINQNLNLFESLLKIRSSCSTEILGCDNFTCEVLPREIRMEFILKNISDDLVIESPKNKIAPREHNQILRAEPNLTK